MSGSDWFEERLAEFGPQVALTTASGEVTYEGLLARIDEAVRALEVAGLPHGSVVGFRGDHSPPAAALLFALVRHATVIVPMGTSSEREVAGRLEIGEVEWTIEDPAAPRPRPTGRQASHEILRRLKDAGRPGLMLFSSGSSGPPKAAVHDLPELLEKFRTRRPVHRTTGFLLLDHIGGLNTLWHVLSNGGVFACLPDRQAETVAREIERQRLELLPTSPTFLNLLLLSGALERHDLSSLRLVTYGTEPMPVATLRRLHAALPGVELRQTYGLSELGILRAKSEASDSLWVKLGGEGYELDVRDGILWIKARSAMLGYLNAPSPFDADGWFDTGDLVETRGEYFRILGRRSELINVGGEKVYPGEVESVILEMPEVAEVAVVGEPNAIVGRVVVAQVVPAVELAPQELRARVRAHVSSRLPRYKVPAKVVIADGSLHTDRFKKKARLVADS